MLNKTTASIKPVIHLVSHTNWEFQELSNANKYDVKQNYGLEIPLYDLNDSWRIPQEPYTHFMLSGARMPVEAPGPLWLDDVPEEVKGRAVTTLTAKEVLNMVVDPESFWKFAEAKNSSFPAQYYSLDTVKEYIIQKNIPSSSYLQFSKRINILNEYRFFIINKKVVTGSLYLQHNPDGTETTIYDGATVDFNEFQKAEVFLQSILTDLNIPNSLVIDVAKTEKGFAILEANPSWCSGWYDCNINLVAEAIQASNIIISSSKWLYKPDQLLISKYQNQRPLPNVINIINKIN